MSKKSFKGENPAMAFITQPTQQTQGTQYTDIEETRSKRINMLLTPSLHENLTKIARVEGRSLNDLINVVLKVYEEENEQSIQRYAEIWG